MAVKQSNARRTIHSLAVFYDAVPSKEERHRRKRSASKDSDLDSKHDADSTDSESEAQLVNPLIAVHNVDVYMTALTRQWGLRWKVVQRMGADHLERQGSLAGHKRGASEDDGRETSNKRAKTRKC